jgi:SAM-dependent methyltransferase
VEGIEYTDVGASLSRLNLERAGVEGVIRQADFFDVPPSSFDLVLSLGFIEHFDDLPRVFARHVAFTAPGGTLAIGVPNYRGLNRRLQQLTDASHLDLHNLDAMRPALYRELAAHHGLSVTFIGHIGGIDPIVIKLGRRWLLPFLLLEGLYRRLPFADRINHPLASSYMLVVMRRPVAV